VVRQFLIITAQAQHPLVIGRLTRALISIAFGWAVAGRAKQSVSVAFLSIFSVMRRCWFTWILLVLPTGGDTQSIHQRQRSILLCMINTLQAPGNFGPPT